MYFCKLQLRRINNYLHRNYVKNQKGFSLIEVLVAISIATVLTAAIINMITVANQSQKNLDQKIASINLVNEIMSVLSNKDACLNTIPTETAFTYDANKSPTVLSNIKNIKNDTSTVKYSAFDDPTNLNQTYQGGMLKINSISVTDYSPLATPLSATDSKFYNGLAKLKIVFEKTTKSPGSQIFVKEISLAFALNNGGANDKTLKSCVAIGNGGTLPNTNFYWIPTAADDGIYYDKKVGIGAKIPTADLDINVTDPTYASTWYGRTSAPADKVFFRILEPTTKASMEVRSLGSLQAPYIAFKKGNDNYDALWIKPPTGGNRLAEFIAISPFLFKADSQNWGFSRPGENLFDFIDTGRGLTATTSQQSVLSVNSNISQQGSASYTGLNVNIIERTVGSGSKNLMQLQKNGADMFTFSSIGNLTQVGELSVGGAVKASGDLSVVGLVKLGGAVKASGDLSVVGILKADGDLRAGRNLIVSNNLSVSGSVNFSNTLNVSGDVNSGTCFTAGSIVVGGVCSSDQKLKKDVHEFNLGLDVLLNLKPQNYKFNGLAGTPNANEETVGLIAQEVQLASNDLVSTRLVKMHPDDLNNSEILTVNYSKLIYVVINAIKDLNKKLIKLFDQLISEQNQKFDSLKNENLELKNELNSLKSVICQLHPKEKICLKQ